MTQAISILPDDLSALVDLLDQQLSLYQQLQRLTAHQSRMVAEQKPESLLEVLAQRQDVIDQVTRLNGQLAPYREHWPEVRRQLDPATRQRAEARIEEMEALLADILAQDERDRQALARDHVQVGKEMGRANSARTAMNAYKAAAGAGYSRHTNRQG